MQEVLDVSSVKAADLSVTDKVLSLVRQYPYRTARELAHKVNADVLQAEQIHKRLPELRKKRLITDATMRTCSITGRYAQTWVAL